MLVFKLSIVCAIAACSLPRDLSNERFEAESVEICKQNVKTLLLFDGLNPNELTIECTPIAPRSR